MTIKQLEVAKTKTKKKKRKGDKEFHPRAMFLTQLMKQVSGEKSEALTTAFFGKDKEAFVELMTELTKKLSLKMPNAEKPTA